MEVLADKIPKALRERDQWVVWKNVQRDGKTVKMPFQVDGSPAKSNDSSTFCSFDKAIRAGWEGVGFVISESDPFVGVDFDGCRDGSIAPWAAEWIRRFASYAELSPSGSGVKLLIEARLELPRGKNRKLDLPEVQGKKPGVEVYSAARFFCITGQRLVGPKEPQPAQAVLDEFCNTYWESEMVVERARRYLATLPPAIEGQGGDRATFHAACILVKGFALNESEALQVLREYNSRCSPPWKEHALQRKIHSAMRSDGPVGYLRDAKDFSAIKVPDYMPDIGDALNECIDVFEGLDPKWRKALLSSLGTVYR